MNGYERRTELKKDKIRSAALELFCAYGTDKTSINEIAQKAGVAPASIYNYFGSKEEMVKDIIISLLESSLKAKKELWESDRPFPELMKRAISMQDDFIEHTNLDLLLQALLNTDPEIKKLIDDIYKRRYPYIVEKFIEKGHKDGYIRRDLSIEAATIYLKMYQDVVQQPEILKDRNKNLLKELYDLMLYGLAGTPIQDKI